jgi:hypothetical protein
MQVTFPLIPILSRVGAVLFLAIAVVLIQQGMAREEQELFATLSHRELLKYLREGQDQSFASGYFYFGLLSLVYLGLVEVLAALFRLWMRFLSPQPALKPIPVESNGCLDQTT